MGIKNYSLLSSFACVFTVQLQLLRRFLVTTIVLFFFFKSLKNPINVKYIIKFFRYELKNGRKKKYPLD